MTYRPDSVVRGAVSAWQAARAAVRAAPADAAARQALDLATRRLRHAVGEAGGAPVASAYATLPCAAELRAVRAAGQHLQDVRAAGIAPGQALAAYRAAYARARDCLGSGGRSRVARELESENGGWHRHGRTLVLDDPYAGEPDEEVFRWLAGKVRSWLDRPGSPPADRPRESRGPAGSAAPAPPAAARSRAPRAFSPGALFARAEQNALRLPPEQRAAYLARWANRLTRLAAARGVEWRATTSRNADGSTLIVGGRADQARVVAPDGTIWQADASDHTQLEPFGVPSYRPPMRPVQPKPRGR